MWAITNQWQNLQRELEHEITNYARQTSPECYTVAPLGILVDGFQGTHGTHSNRATECI